MKRDGIAEPRSPNAPDAPERGEAHVWRIELPAADGRAAARRALREILGAYLGKAPEEDELTVGEGGKPALAGRGPSAGGQGAATPVAGSADDGVAPLSFNLSHSGGLALVAVTAGGIEVGIDVERVRPRRDLARLAARWLPAEDAEVLAAAAHEDREKLFYAAWTRYEARTKCAGTGISGPPPGPTVAALPLEIDPGYAAALAVDLGAAAAEGADRISLRRLDFAGR
jgi:4'-phosphopantetheinyl transferase